MRGWGREAEFERLSAIWTGLRLPRTVVLHFESLMGSVNPWGLKKHSPKQVHDFPSSGCLNKLPGQQALIVHLLCTSPASLLATS